MDLGFGVCVTDLVEKNHPAVGLFENPSAVGVGAGEGTPLVPEQLRIGQFAAVGGDIGFLDRQLAGASESLPEQLVEPGKDVVEEELLAAAGVTADENGWQADAFLPEVSALPAGEAVEEGEDDPFDDLDDLHAFTGATDDIAEPVGGDFRVLVADIGAQPADYRGQFLDPLHIGEVAGDEAGDDQQDPLMFLGKEVGPQAVETDDGDDLFVTDYRHADLTLDDTVDHPVVRSRSLPFRRIGQNDRLPGMSRIAGETPILRAEFLPADTQRRDAGLQPFDVFGPHQGAVLVFHHQPFLPGFFPDQGDAAGVGADQLGRLGQHLAQKRPQSLELFREQLIDLGEDLDLHVLAADLDDNPFGHFGVGLQQSFFEGAELVGVAGVVIDDADHPPGLGVEAGNNVEGLESDLLGQIAFLQLFGGEIGKIMGN